jgi:hypothetical protein
LFVISDFICHSDSNFLSLIPTGTCVPEGKASGVEEPAVPGPASFPSNLLIFLCNPAFRSMIRGLRRPDLRTLSADLP